MLCSRIRAPSRARWSAKKAANSAGVLPRGSIPIVPMRRITSPSRIAAPAASPSRATIAGGVPAGTKKPSQS
jgi:hypothetical protein